MPINGIDQNQINKVKAEADRTETAMIEALIIMLAEYDKLTEWYEESDEDEDFQLDMLRTDIGNQFMADYDELVED